MPTDRDANRRDVLHLLAGAGLVPLIGCGGAGRGGEGSGGVDGGGGSACEEIPAETAGPFPGDGTNGANALALPGVVRKDIRSSIAGASGAAEGVLLTLELTLVDAATGCAPLAGHAVYVWHCDREGRYSMYSEGVTAENYLRGVQESDADGLVTFTTVFPGCYPGRWPHIHFAVYPSVDDAVGSTAEVRTSQLAFPGAACSEAYGAPGYEASVDALADVSFESDGVFSDGGSAQLAAMTGDAGAGFVASLRVAVTR